MSAFRTLDDAGSLTGKRVLMRVDLNVPMDNGRVTDATRIDRVAPTIREVAEKGARVILLAHFGRPKGKREAKDSLEPVVPALGAALGRPVAFAPDCIGEEAAKAVAALKDGDVLLLENTRYHAGEEQNDAAFADALAANGDIYVNEAFSAAHRAHASTEGLAHRLPAYAGREMQAELEALTKGLESPQRPVIALVGGAKVSSKIDLLENLVAKVDRLVIGGGMANTFLHAQGKSVGKSLCEKDLAETATRILAAAEKAGCRIILPVDAVAATEFKAHAPHETVPVDAVPETSMILDAGPRSVAEINAAIDGAKTLVWNGPLGAFELSPFDAATVAAAKHAASRTKTGQLVSVAGGGDTVAALNHAGVAGDFTYVSTAGGAFLEWLEGKEEDEIREMIVSYSGKDRVLAAIHAFAERTLWIGNEVMVRSGEPVYILEEGWGDRPRRGRVRTTDDLGQPHEAEYPAAEQVHRANAIHEVLAAAANGTVDYDPDDPTTFRQLLPDFVEVIDGSMLRYVHDETPRFISRIKSVAEQLWERIREEPVPVLLAWAEMRDAVRKEGVSGQEVADTVRGLIAAVEHCYPSANGRLNWRAENARRELELWEYAPIPEEEATPSGPAPR